MTRTFMNIFSRMIFTVFGIVLISAFLGLFIDGVHLKFSLFIENFIEIIKYLNNPGQELEVNYIGTKIKLFPGIWSFYLYSIIIFISSFLLSLIISSLISIATFFLSKKVVRKIVYLASLLESLPDIFIIIIIQFIVIWIYKKTGLLLFPVAGAFERAYFLPILTLTILPTIMFYRIIILLMEEEFNKPYTEFGRSKGFRLLYILCIHVLRNIAISVANHSKSIIWVMLSNLIIFERLFNIYGLFNFIFQNPNICIICTSLILFYIPIVILLSIIRLIIEKTTGQEVLL
ncbi:ABC transporter permease subunit [Fictibacillus sp. Mic-4]|uniref:ABC transporter permease subunit n=1 Tax=Fictibacillus sp. Mic-4 TaxID=3132826 RepID=UPI003CEF9EF0